ncbi:MAG: dTMP kinase [Verrucomicrobiia bacterium]
MARKGTFITFEGGEGCGKSTQVQRLAARLQKEGYCVDVRREPGGTEIGDQIRHILKFSYKTAPMTAETELLLFCANRAQLVREVITPILRSESVVICDRYHDSTTVYQGLARELDMGVVRTINNFAIGGCIPDITIVIDIDPKIGHERIRNREREMPDQLGLFNGELFDRMESVSLEFSKRVRQGYLDLAKREPKRVKVIAGSQSIEAVGKQIWELVRHVLQRSA